MESRVAFDHQLSRAKWYGIAAAGALVVSLMPDIAGAGVVAVFAFALLIACGAQSLFYGATAISMKLEAGRRRRFEVGVAVALPVLLAAFNLQGVALEPLVEHVSARLGFPTLGGIAFWAAIGWASVGFFPSVHRVRGVLVLVGVLLLLSWLRLVGALPLTGGPVGAEEMIFFLLWSAAALGAVFARLRIMGK